jgi:nicotinamide mononucleotide transporter
MQNIPFDFILMLAEWAAAGLGLLGVFLGFRQHRSTWLAWLTSSLLYLGLTWLWALYGQMLVMVSFVGVSLWGYVQWNRPRAPGTVPLSVQAGARDLLGCGFLWLVLALALSELGSSLALLDAAIATLSLLAMVWTARRHLACWPAWLMVNLLSMGLYSTQSLWPTVALYFVQAVLAGFGLQRWRVLGLAQGERAVE